MQNSKIFNLIICFVFGGLLWNSVAYAHNEMIKNMQKDVVERLILLGRNENVRLAVVSVVRGARYCTSQRLKRFKKKIIGAITQAQIPNISVIPRDDFLLLDDEVRYFSAGDKVRKSVDRLMEKRRATHLLLLKESSEAYTIRLMSVNDAVLLWNKIYERRNNNFMEEKLECDCSYLCASGVDIGVESRIVRFIKGLRDRCAIRTQPVFWLLKDCVRWLPKSPLMPMAGGYSIRDVVDACDECGGRLPTVQELEQLLGCEDISDGEEVPCRHQGVLAKCLIGSKRIFFSVMSEDSSEKFSHFRCVFELGGL